MERRVIIAIAVSLLIIISFQYLSPKPAGRQVTEAGSIPDKAAALPETAAVIAAPAEKPINEEETVVETGRYSMVFSNIGGAIKRLALKDYKERLSGDYLNILSVNDPNNYLLSLNSATTKSQINIIPYKVTKDGNDIVYSARVDDFEIIKRYIIDPTKYGIELEVTVKNISNTTKEFGYKIIGGSDLQEADEADKRFVEVTAMINGKNVGFKRPKDGAIVNPGIVAWSALKNKYFSIILKPMVPTKNQFYKATANDGFVMGVESEAVSIPEGSAISNKFILFMGPGNSQSLKSFGYELDETVNYGFFGGISKALIFVMRSIYLVVRNWGISIILLSVLLNVVLFPLTVKSFKSMQKMHELHPQMEKLKAQHKNSPDKLNKEIMELYKKYKINPLSGCLPMLLQMPIFIGLYSALIRSIELRGAEFLWIKDLSMPDAVRLPAAFPIIGNSINILPLIMIVGMVIQQKMSTKTMGSAVTDEQKQQQKMMLIVMPIVFGFIFYSMPAGLVIYWIVNTALTIVEQALVLRSAESE